MSEHDNLIRELLLTAMRHAAGAAGGRVGRPVTVAGDAALPASASLLRFDLRFEGGELLAWYVANEEATGFADLLIGGAGDREAVLTEMHLDALSSAFSEMLEHVVEGLNGSLVSPLTPGMVDMGMDGAIPDPESGGVRLVSSLQIEGYGPLTIVSQVDAALASVLAAHARPDALQAQPVAAVPDAGGPGPQSAGAAGSEDNVVQLPNPPREPVGDGKGDISMLLNVPLEVTVELGRTQQTIGDLLQLNVGSIIELAKLAGDPMEIMVNGRVLARGEVVVIDEEFGVRVTEILSPEERLRKLS